MTDYESIARADAGIRRVWLIEAVDGSIVKPKWYESESDAREAAPGVTGHGDDWEACWRVTSFVRNTESQSGGNPLADLFRRIADELDAGVRMTFGSDSFRRWANDVEAAVARRPPPASLESKPVDGACPLASMAWHLSDAIREGRRGDARTLAALLTRLLGAEIPETECKSCDEDIHVWVVVDSAGEVYPMDDESEARRVADLWSQEHPDDGPHEAIRMIPAMECRSIDDAASEIQAAIDVCEQEEIEDSDLMHLRQSLVAALEHLGYQELGINDARDTDCGSVEGGE